MHIITPKTCIIIIFIIIHKKINYACLKLQDCAHPRNACETCPYKMQLVYVGDDAPLFAINLIY